VITAGKRHYYGFESHPLLHIINNS
jgi:hypothetical protein